MYLGYGSISSLMTNAGQYIKEEGLQPRSVQVSLLTMTATSKLLIAFFILGLVQSQYFQTL